MLLVRPVHAAWRCQRGEAGADVAGFVLRDDAATDEETCRDRGAQSTVGFAATGSGRAAA
jgi:hypothetical protein